MSEAQSFEEIYGFEGNRFATISDVQQFEETQQFNEIPSPSGGSSPPTKPSGWNAKTLNLLSATVVAVVAVAVVIPGFLSSDVSADITYLDVGETYISFTVTYETESDDMLELQLMDGPREVFTAPASGDGFFSATVDNLKPGHTYDLRLQYALVYTVFEKSISTVPTLSADISYVPHANSIDYTVNLSRYIASDGVYMDFMQGGQKLATVNATSETITGTQTGISPGNSYEIIVYDGNGNELARKQVFAATTITASLTVTPGDETITINAPLTGYNPDTDAESMNLLMEDGNGGSVTFAHQDFLKGPNNSDGYWYEVNNYSTDIRNGNSYTVKVYQGDTVLASQTVTLPVVTSVTIDSATYSVGGLQGGPIVTAYLTYADPNARWSDFEIKVINADSTVVGTIGGDIGQIIMTDTSQSIPLQYVGVAGTGYSVVVTCTVTHADGTVENDVEVARGEYTY